MIKNNESSNNEFVFSKDAWKQCEIIFSRYPRNQKNSAVMPLLDLAMRESGGWLPIPAIEYVAKLTEMPFIKVYEVASFYSMFNLEPIGKYFIQICSTTPCWLRGSDAIADICYKKLNIKNNQTTKDGMFTIKEVECLGACVNAPMLQINDDYYEDLDTDSIDKIIDNLKAGKVNKIGTQLHNRKKSEPFNGRTTLKEKLKDA